MSYQLVDGKYVIDRSPTAILQYGIDLTEWLAGASILTATVADILGVTNTVQPGATISGNTILVWISGGVINEPAYVTLYFTTGNPDYPADARTIYFNVVKR